jgi:hypothetical protein
LDYFPLCFDLRDKEDKKLFTDFFRLFKIRCVLGSFIKKMKNKFSFSQKQLQRVHISLLFVECFLKTKNFVLSSIENTSLSINSSSKNNNSNISSLKKSSTSLFSSNSSPYINSAFNNSAINSESSTSLPFPNINEKIDVSSFCDCDWNIISLSCVERPQVLNVISPVNTPKKKRVNDTVINNNINEKKLIPNSSSFSLLSLQNSSLSSSSTYSAHQTSSILSNDSLLLTPVIMFVFFTMLYIYIYSKMCDEL